MISNVDALQAYAQDGYLKVEGWVLPAAITVLGILNQASIAEHVKGGACEIGVHHGRFFLAMLECVGSPSKSLAIDLFNAQDLNVDHSGCGSLEAFLRNIKQHSNNSAAVETMAADSLSIGLTAITDIRDRLGGFRLFSVDGGHTRVHALHDILIAQELTNNGGIIIVDDFFQPDWPGVTEGVSKYFDTSDARLAPLCVGGGKLFLTSVSFHKKYIEFIGHKVAGARPTVTAKWINLYGWNSFSLRTLGKSPVIL